MSAWTDEALAVVGRRGWTVEAIERLGLSWRGGQRPVGIPVRDETAAQVGSLAYDPTGRADPKMLASAGSSRELFPPPETIGEDDPPRRIVVLTEGEPDAIAAWSAGLVAVGVPGVQGWKREYAARFHGPRWTVVVTGDCDESGRDFARRAATDLVAAGVDVRVVDLAPGRDDAYDLTDYLCEHDADKLLDLAEEAPPFDPEATRLAELEQVIERGLDTAVQVLEAREALRATQREPTMSLEALLDAVVAFVRRFVVLDEAQAVAAALWTGHAHAIEAAHATPYLHVNSPEPESGKTRMLEVLQELAPNPLSTMNISDAALFRAIAAERPTLFLDEVDSIFNAHTVKTGAKDDLRSLLNAGYRRGQLVYRMGGGNHTTLERFEVFCPKALAGIGSLPDTLASRCIRIELKRRRRDEPIEDFIPIDHADETGALREELRSWSSSAVTSLRGMPSTRVEGLRDRQNEVWRPLLAIGALAGGEWPARARRAAVALAAGGASDEPSLGLLLLGDVRIVFDEREATRIATADLIDALARIEESPWGEWWLDSNGSPNKSGPRRLAQLLRPYGIRPHANRVGGASALRGYRLEDFVDAWERFLPEPRPDVTPVTAVTPESQSQADVTGVTGVTSRRDRSSSSDEDEVERLHNIYERARQEEGDP